MQRLAPILHVFGLAILIFSFTMLLGRIELFTVFVLFTRAFWRV